MDGGIHAYDRFTFGGLARAQLANGVRGQAHERPRHPLTRIASRSDLSPQGRGEVGGVAPAQASPTVSNCTASRASRGDLPAHITYWKAW